MRILFIIVFQWVVVVAVHSQSRQVDVIQYRFAIEVNDRDDTLRGSATIQARALQPLDDFPVQLASLKNLGKGFLLDSVTGARGNKLSAVFSRDTIKISNIARQGDTIVATIHYRGIPADGLIISRNKFGKRTFFADNWPNRAHQWIPCVDDPGDKAAVEFLVTAPAGYKVISNGLLIEERLLSQAKKLTHWKETAPLPTKVMVVGIADFSVDGLKPLGTIGVSSWSFPENANEARSDYSYATEVLDFFTRYIGPYPYKKLANVQSKTIFGGMENASAIFYFENSVNGLKDKEDLVAHEIVHQWFGNSATEKSFAHLWLSEGFATYLTNIYLGAKYGDEIFKKRLLGQRAEVIDFSTISQKPVVDSVSAWLQLLNANSYQKGGWVLHMLRKTLGDSIFKASIQRYYLAYAGRNAETSDLQKIFEKVSGRDLSAFFKQWLFTTGQPLLQKSWTYNPKNKKLSLTIQQLQEQPFRFPLDIAMETSVHQTLKKQLSISKPVQTFIFPVKNKVVNVVLDPDVALLFSEVK